MTLPQIPDGRAPQIISARGEVAKIRNAIAETTRRGVINQGTGALPRFFAYRGTALTNIPASTWTYCGCPNIIRDNYGGAFSGAYQIPLAGWYYVQGSFPIAGGSTGLRACMLTVNGSTIANYLTGTEAIEDPGEVPITARLQFLFAAGDIVRLLGYQSDTGPASTSATGYSVPTLTVDCDELT